MAVGGDDPPVRRSDPALWERSKEAAVARLGGRFSARAMQMAVRLYKEAGGRYASPKPPAARNALARWSKEAWGYVGAAGKSRYLPAAVAAKLTPSEKRRTNAAKLRSTAQWSRQPADVAAKAAAVRREMWARRSAAACPFSAALADLRRLEREVSAETMLPARRRKRQAV